MKQLLEAVRDRRLGIDEGARQLAALPCEPLGHTHVDHQREDRCGESEVVYAAGKTSEQVVAIAQAIVARSPRLLVTRVDGPTAKLVCAAIPAAVHHERARCVTWASAEPPPSRGDVVVVCAGTSDLPVAEEALLAARHGGAQVELIADVGVAGLHRLLARLERLRQAETLVVVAGMEGALPSVVGGLVACPVIAVPTSVGYGASFEGLAALLGMLNSCAGGVTVVNIDNGYGAGCAAARIARTVHGRAARKEST
jgi:NCAIR mutase (PurE)-related protein